MLFPSEGQFDTPNLHHPDDREKFERDKVRIKNETERKLRKKSSTFEEIKAKDGILISPWIYRWDRIPNIDFLVLKIENKNIERPIQPIVTIFGTEVAFFALLSVYNKIHCTLHAPKTPKLLRVLTT